MSMANATTSSPGMNQREQDGTWVIVSEQLERRMHVAIRRPWRDWWSRLLLRPAVTLELL